MTEMGWWCISGEDLMAMLHAVQDGAHPDLVYARHRAKAVLESYSVEKPDQPKHRD